MFYQLSNVILNTSVDLLTLRPFTILINFSFSLSLWRTFPCWYVSQTIFFSLLLIISSNSQITDVVSSHFCILSAFSSICFNFFINEQFTSSSFLISSLVFLIVLLFSEILSNFLIKN